MFKFAALMNFYTYFYPGFYNDTYRLSGSEWNIVRKAQPRSKDHHQPRIPQGGYYNQAETTEIKNQITLARTYGIKGFMVCYYWDFEQSCPIMDEPLKQLMLAVEGTDFEFNLMWVLRLPHRILPIEEGSYGKYHNHPWFKKRIQDFQDDKTFFEELQRISNHPNYRKGKEGKPLLQVYSVSELIQLHGEKVPAILNQFQNFHLQGICGRDDDWIAASSNLGFSSLSAYVTLVNFNADKVKLRHAACAAEQPMVWNRIQEKTNLPFYPSVATGWDASPRGSHLPNFKVRKFPWAPVVMDANPDSFHANLRDAVAWSRANRLDDVHIASWNEWSEGHYLEPDMKYGTAFLEKVYQTKKSS
ncbi:MAG: hypothetical protein EBU82_02395 [Flavobacteriia bacterium]|nr:hypothetical protein [Flavobacteriia bacterium]